MAYFVEGQKRAGELAGVGHGYSHPVVDLGLGVSMGGDGAAGRGERVRGWPGRDGSSQHLGNNCQRKGANVRRVRSNSPSFLAVST